MIPNKVLKFKNSNFKNIPKYTVYFRWAGPSWWNLGGTSATRPLSGRNQPSVRLGLSWAASRPAAAGALGWPGGREENEAELGVSFGPNCGAIVHFSTSSPTWPPKRIAARAASQRLPRPFGPRQSPVGAKLRNYPEKFGRHTDPGSPKPLDF